MISLKNTSLYLAFRNQMPSSSVNASFSPELVLKLSEEQWYFPLGHWNLQSKHQAWWGSSAARHLPSMFQVLGFSSSSKINWLISNHRCPFAYLTPWTYLKVEHSATCLWSQILKKLAQEGCLNSVSKASIIKY